MQFVKKVEKPTTKANVLYSVSFGVEKWLVHIQEIQYPRQQDTPNTISQEIDIDVLQEVIQIFHIRPPPHCFFGRVDVGEAGMLTGEPL